jgi:hypothetical protein
MKGSVLLPPGVKKEAKQDNLTAPGGFAEEFPSVVEPPHSFPNAADAAVASTSDDQIDQHAKKKKHHHKKHHHKHHDHFREESRNDLLGSTSSSKNNTSSVLGIMVSYTAFL